MSYIQKNLVPGEQIRYEAHMHWFFYAWPCVLIAAGIVIACLSPADTETDQFTYYAVLSIGGLLGLWGTLKLLSRQLFAWGAEFAVTNRRIILKTGVVSRHSFDLVLAKCEGVSVDQSICGRIFGYGSINVSTGEIWNTYRFISSPNEFKNAISVQIQEANSSKSQS